MSDKTKQSYSNKKVIRDVLIGVCIALIYVAVLITVFNSDLKLDSSNIPVGLIDHNAKSTLWYMPTCPEGTVGIIDNDDPLYDNRQTCYDDITMIELQCGVNQLASGYSVTIGCTIP